MWVPYGREPCRTRVRESEAPIKSKRSDIAGTLETILVVDDEEYIRELVGAILSIEGYNVVEADGGAQALRVAEEFPGRIHMMLSDVVMSPMGGKELAKRISPIRPDMKIIFISGYPEGFEAVRTEMFLAKPFTPKALVQKIRTVLDSIPAQLQA